MDNSDPTTRPAEVSGWPKLNIFYRTDPDKVAELLPPGLEPGEDPTVQIGIYCVPVREEPEFGVSTKVRARWDGIDGWYSLGMGIDQESAIFISQETNGQPKYPCDIKFYRLGDQIEARCTHQGYTFLEFSGEVTGTEAPSGDDREENEWWIKSIRALNGAPNEWDFPPHIIRVQQVSEMVHAETLAGELRLLESPWDPHTRYLPFEELLSAKLVTNRHKSRTISKAGTLDPDAFWPYADVIGGSRWPGERGGPRPA
ncbi:MAG: acetoacetate decarboxylase family protein [Acidimicrobiales bacterium]